ncbi:MAG: hypothetical protein NT141_00060 [candidate division WWE3 bacterium]|nr:hypothetical protein [candidate division WWE3 bacterium]
MKNLTTIFYSPKYSDIEPNTDASWTKRYFLDSTIKSKWVYEALLSSDIKVAIKEPLPLNTKDFLLAHTESYVNTIMTGSPADTAGGSGIHWSSKVLETQSFVCGGLYNACVEALKTHSVSGTLSSGFHHAHADFGTGFCIFNGLAIAAKKLQNECLAKKILIFDCDVHYGNGTAAILKSSKDILNISIYKNAIQKGTQSIDNVASGNVAIRVSTADEYLSEIKKLPGYIETFKSDLVIYNAGMDAFENDRLGGISGITSEILKERDDLVFETCRKYSAPVAFSLEGGYVTYKDKSGKLLSEAEVAKSRNNLVSLYLSLIRSGL